MLLTLIHLGIDLPGDTPHSINDDEGGYAVVSYKALTSQQGRDRVAEGMTDEETTMEMKQNELYAISKPRSHQ